MRMLVLSFIAVMTGCGSADDDVARQVREIVASQYRMQPRGVAMDRPMREFGADTGLQHSLNYVEVIQRVEARFKITLPGDLVLDKSKAGIELIPAAATPEWLAGLARERMNSPAPR